MTKRRAYTMGILSIEKKQIQGKKIMMITKNINDNNRLNNLGS